MPGSIDTIEQLGSEGTRPTSPPEVGPGTGLVYFGNRCCPFAHRAWLALHEKNLISEIKYNHIDLGKRKQEWFSQINPYGTVPCLYDDGKAIFESLFVVEYLEDKFPGRGTALLPKDPYERATIRLFLDKCVSTLTSSFYPLIKAQDPKQIEEKM